MVCGWEKNGWGVESEGDETHSAMASVGVAYGVENSTVIVLDTVRASVAYERTRQANPNRFIGGLRAKLEGWGWRIREMW